MGGCGSRGLGRVPPSIGGAGYDAASLGQALAAMQQQAAYEQALLRALIEENQRRWQQLFAATMQLGEDDLRAALHSPVAEIRFTAAYVVGEKGLPWHRDLIPLLQDRTDGVRQAARRGLVILSFLALNPEVAQRLRSQRPGTTAGGGTPSPAPAGADEGEGGRALRRPPVAPAATAALAEPAAPAKLVSPVDFGPARWAPLPARAEAVRRWTKWWDEREAGSTSTAAVHTQAAEDPQRLTEELLTATRRFRWDVVERYRDAHGVEYTEALALAAARLVGELKRRVREALALRMTRMADATLVRYLGDDDTEIRRAAALGLGQRESVSTADRVVELLLDANPDVERAAHAALCHLSGGQDFGPPAGASQSQRVEAAARWRIWWKKK
jgi:hypothetical protein